MEPIIFMREGFVMKKDWVFGVALVILCFLFVAINFNNHAEVYNDEALMNSYIEYMYGDGYCGILKERCNDSDILFTVYTRNGEPFKHIAVSRSYATQIHERG
jgi:hypothetical protein